MVWKIDAEMGNEAGKIAPHIVQYTRGRGLDVGCGPSKTFPHFIGVDSGRAYEGKQVTDLKLKSSELSLFADASMDFVFSSHLLEHLNDTEAALAQWWRLIKPGGHLVLYLPHKKFYPNIGEVGTNPDHKHDFLPVDIQTHMEGVAKQSGFGWDMVEDEERNETNEYSFFQVYRKHKTHPSGFACNYVPWRRPEKSCLVIRYGAIGDHLMASSVLPLLKEQGYHVTYNTSESGEDILKHCPYIDVILGQDANQVPNHLLEPYWGRLSERYDVVHNLSESIEGALLPPAGRINHNYPDTVRRRRMGKVNYVEETHDICDVPFKPNPRFYESSKERMWAKKEMAKFLKKGRHPVILWALSGSALHKMWPHIDAAFARLMLESDARIVTVGDPLCQMLEIGWEKEKRIKRRSGEWSYRETLAFAQQADIVVGPETGVLNAVSMLPEVAKVIMLSHSSHENLTRDWENTTVLQVKDLACSPCHRLHYPGSTTCPKHEETGAAVCAFLIPVEEVVEAIHQQLRGQRKAA